MKEFFSKIYNFIKTHKNKILIVLVILVVIFLLATGLKEMIIAFLVGSGVAVLSGKIKKKEEKQSELRQDINKVSDAIIAKKEEIIEKEQRNEVKPDDIPNSDISDLLNKRK